MSKPSCLWGWFQWNAIIGSFWWFTQKKPEGFVDWEMSNQRESYFHRIPRVDFGCQQGSE
jgi:hypothetical protein